MPLTDEEFLSIALANPVNAALVAGLPSLGLGQCLLTAGCLFQAVWNHQAGRPVASSVKDYDVFYFDEDLSWEAENEVIQAAAALFGHLGANIEVKNQARVHLWYGERFARPYPQLRTAKDGVDRYPVAGTCIALAPATLELYAPFGLQDVETGVLRMNPNNPQPDLFLRKAHSYRERWPWLSIEQPVAQGLAACATASSARTE